jgi:sterol desaturase/sphingolipid hydroxylase (fatty acid hydroxylase superfamily)
MDLIALAVPFFLVAIIIELLVNWRKRKGYYRSNDAINSISAGMLDTTLGYFTKVLPMIGWGFALQNLSLFEMPLSWFDASLRGLALWALAAIAWDFLYYWFHRFSHEISILWAAHAVHHQSEDYNLSTALRQTSTGFLFGWVFYLPLFLIGFPLEIVLTVNAVNLLYQFWVHTQLIRSLGPLERVMMTPSHHRVHHAQNERYIDKNYGGMFIIWDRMFGTYEPESDEEPVIFGVRKPLESWNPFWANLQVYDYLLFDARKAKRWQDKPAMQSVGRTRSASGFVVQDGDLPTWRRRIRSAVRTSSALRNSIRRLLPLSHATS